MLLPVNRAFKIWIVPQLCFDAAEFGDQLHDFSDVRVSGNFHEVAARMLPAGDVNDGLFFRMMLRPDQPERIGSVAIGLDRSFRTFKIILRQSATCSETIHRDCDRLIRNLFFKLCNLIFELIIFGLNYIVCNMHPLAFTKQFLDVFPIKFHAVQFTNTGATNAASKSEMM